MIMLRSFFRAPLAVFGAIVLSGVIFCALLAPWISPHDPSYVDVSARLLPPMWQDGGTSMHPLGTDGVGRDVFSRLVYSARISLIIGVGAVGMAAVLGVILGLVAGYFGRWAGSIIMRLADVQLAFPSILLYIAVLALWGSGILNLIIVLGLTNWVLYARVLHGSVLSIREKEYVEAARAVGHSDGVIIFRHILPNVVAPLIVIGSFSVGSMVMAESTMSFLGLGVPPSVPTWGGMLSDGRDYIVQAWWLPTLPGLAILLTVLSFNTVGDWLRDWLDPHTRNI